MLINVTGRDYNITRISCVVFENEKRDSETVTTPH